MKTYEFEGYSPVGVRVFGNIEADSEKMAYSRARAYLTEFEGPDFIVVNVYPRGD